MTEHCYAECYKSALYAENCYAKFRYTKCRFTDVVPNKIMYMHKSLLI
jgi:hypothetical protein